MASNRSCICCGDKYSYCPSCGSDRFKPAWYATFCSETCKTLWETLSKYSMKFVSEKEAAETIQSLSLKDKSQYVACVQRDMEKFLIKTTKPKRTKKTEPKIPEPVAANAVEEEPVPTEELIPAEAVISVEETIPVAEELHEGVNKTEENK